MINSSTLKDKIKTMGRNNKPQEKKKNGSDELDSLHKRVTKIEKELSLFSKVSLFSTIVAIVIGGGGLLGYFKYFSSASRELRELELTDKKLAMLNRNIDLFDKHGEDQRVQHLLTEVAKIQRNELGIAENYKMIPDKRNLEVEPDSLQIEAHQVNNASILYGLPNQSALVTANKIDKDGKIISNDIDRFEKNATYSVVYEFAQFRTELKSIDEIERQSRLSVLSNQKTQSLESEIRVVRVGIAIRIKINLFVVDNSFSFIGIPSLAIASEKGFIQGSLTMETVGISGKFISSSLPMPSSFNSQSLDESFNVLNSMKSLLTDKDTMLHPQIIGILSTENWVDR